MNLYLRLLSFLRSHLRLFVLAMVCMLACAAFSGGIVALVVPFSRILFYGGELERNQNPSVSSMHQTPEGTTQPAGPKEGWLKGWQGRLKTSVYGAVRGRDRVDTLGRFCILVLLIFLLKNLFWYAQSFLIAKVEQSVIRDIRDELYRHYLRLPIEYYNEARAGTLVSRITNDVNLVRGAIANGFAQAIRQGLLVIAYLVVVLAANWRLFLITLLVAPPSLYLIDRISRRLRRYSSRSQERMANLTGAIQETISGVRVVKAFNLEDHMGERFRRVNQAFTSAMIRMTRTGSLAPPVTEILGAMVGVLIFYLGGET